MNAKVPKLISSTCGFIIPRIPNPINISITKNATTALNYGHTKIVTIPIGSVI